MFSSRPWFRLMQSFLSISNASFILLLNQCGSCVSIAVSSQQGLPLDVATYSATALFCVFNTFTAFGALLSVLRVACRSHRCMIFRLRKGFYKRYCISVPLIVGPLGALKFVFTHIGRLFPLREQMVSFVIFLCQHLWGPYLHD